MDIMIRLVCDGVDDTDTDANSEPPTFTSC